MGNLKLLGNKLKRLKKYDMPQTNSVIADIAKSTNPEKRRKSTRTLIENNLFFILYWVVTFNKTLLKIYGDDFIISIYHETLIELYNRIPRIRKAAGLPTIVWGTQELVRVRATNFEIGSINFHLHPLLSREEKEVRRNNSLGQAFKEPFAIAENSADAEIYYQEILDHLTIKAQEKKMSEKFFWYTQRHLNSIRLQDIGSIVGISKERVRQWCRDVQPFINREIKKMGENING